MTRKPRTPRARRASRWCACRTREGLPICPPISPTGAAGMDLLAAVPSAQPLRLAPGARALVPTGLILELPPGFEAQVRPRSGLALRHGITVLNSPGTIDSDYRGEVQVLLVNLGDAPFAIARGERIAQLVVQRVERAALVEVDAAAATTPRRRRLRLDGQGAGATKARVRSRAALRTKSQTLAHAVSAHITAR